MDRNTEIALVRRALAHAEKKTTDRADAPTTTPARAYIDPSHYLRELTHLFRSDVPLAVAHASRLGGPGDYFVHDATGVPLLVVREDDGSVAAFMNVCRHRGTRLVNALCGKGARAFVCPYHAWSYGRDGALLGIPHERSFMGSAGERSLVGSAGDHLGRGLVRVCAGLAGGLIWISPRPALDATDATLNASDWLGPIAADLETFGLPEAHVYDPRTYTKDVNWKLGIDIFLEAYHLKTAHKDSIYGLFFDNLGLVEPMGPHLRNVFPKRSITDLASTEETTWSLRHHANILFHIFPNTLVLVQPDHTAVLHLWPDGPARTLLTTYTLVPKAPETDKARAYWDANNKILYGATDEDFTLGESIQRGIASGANDTFLFGAFEHALAHFHAEIERRIPSTPPTHESA